MIDPPAFPRRLFLVRSLQTAALAGLPWWGSACAPGGEEEGLVTFSQGQYRVADTFARTLIPDGGAFEAGAGTVALAKRMDAFLTGERPEIVNGFGTALWMLNLGPLLVIGKPRRFTGLAPADRDAYLDALPGSFSPARDVYGALRRAFMFLFYDTDASWGPIGYDGPWVRSEAGGSR